MKRIFVLFALALAIALPAAAQTKGTTTVTITGASAKGIPLSWTAPVATSTTAGCSTGTPCTYVVNVIAGTCPATVVGSAGWLPFTAISATSFTDTTETPGATVSYVVQTFQGTNQSAPSACVSTTVPLPPGPATALSA